MPFNPQQVGLKLINSGNKQIETGNKIKEYSLKVRTVGLALQNDQTIAGSMVSIESGTRSVRNLLGPVASAFHGISNLLDSITVPTINFTSATLDIPVIGRRRLITGITLGSARPFRTIATRFENIADDLDSVRNALLIVADGINSVQDQLPAIALNLLNGSNDMNQAGQALIDGGTAMTEAGNLISAP